MPHANRLREKSALALSEDALNKVVFSANDLKHALTSLTLVDACRSESAGKRKSALVAKHANINNISLDSRAVDSKTVFVALKGSQSDGYDYIGNAIEQGCTLVLSERELNEHLLKLANEHHVSVYSVPSLKAHLSKFLSQLYAINFGSLCHISAVTGTNGKTSVASLYAQLGLAGEQKFDQTSASLGTLGLNVLSSKSTASLPVQSRVDAGPNTTPDIITHFKVLALLQALNIESYCFEASSHAIEQGRVHGIAIKTAIFTNLTQDHLDYHKTMEAYGAAKRDVLAQADIENLVLNADDAESKHWFADFMQIHSGQRHPAQRHPAQTPASVKKKRRVLWFATDKANIPDDAEYVCVAQNIRCLASGLVFDLESTWGNARVELALLGKFNVLNFLAALGAHLLQGKTLSSLLAKASSLKGVDGRMELFVNKVTQNASAQRGNFIVDYAHTPDALKQALLAAKAHTQGKLHCVFGCGGDRDTSKRPLMGEIAARYSDAITLTEDNSRSESISNIIDDILQGMRDSQVPVHVEPARKQAIRWTWDQSQSQDLILLAGKGHEDYLEIMGERVFYSEREFVSSLIASQEATV